MPKKRPAKRKAPPKSLVIVESPTKARTISRFLGKDFIVDSSYGHIRDLPSSKLGVDVENDFSPHYMIPRKAMPVVKRLKAEVAKVERVILATDEDREGEAIAWHLSQALNLNGEKEKDASTSKKKKTPIGPKIVERIVFHEITKRAIEEALEYPRTIDEKLVDAQQARRILDRLVGYKLSPFLWKKMYRGLSAGRVQSVALRLIAEREREIDRFKPQEYWTIEATLSQMQNDEVFKALLAKIGGTALEKFSITTEARASQILERLRDASWRVENVEQRASVKNPLPPFTTSTLQQEAFRRLGFSSRQTMRLAQQLYEGVELGTEGSAGLITYMRTDSVNLSGEAVARAGEVIKEQFGSQYALPAPRAFKTKTKGAQEAHEAIRPTEPSRMPELIKESLDVRQYKLYDLIWRRFMATQMPQAIFDSTSVEISATPVQAASEGDGHYTFRTTGQIMRFDGFLKVYPMKVSETTLPPLTPKETLDLKEVKPLQHFTEPPPRFTEASLVKTLEHNGIGRPSTYAPTISTILDRRYIERHERRYLKPTETGFLVNDLLVEHFPQIVDTQFTARMEEQLDEIAEGAIPWQPIIKEFYEPFAEHLAAKYEEVKKHTVEETTDEMCEKCGKPMVVKLGRFGKFLACSGFPDCKGTKTLKKEPPEQIGMKCPKCIEGEVIKRFTKRRKLFFGCSRYPACDYASWENPLTSEQKEQKEELPEE